MTERDSVQNRLMRAIHAVSNAIDVCQEYPTPPDEAHGVVINVQPTELAKLRGIKAGLESALRIVRDESIPF